MHMKEIRKQLIIVVIILIATAFLTVWFAMKCVTEAMLVFGIVSVVLIIRVVAQASQLSDAKLICDNCILTVPVAVISVLDSMKKGYTDEIIVSTFGILIGCKIYKWGCAGLHGVRLSSIEFDGSKVYLTFSDGTETMQAVLLHGMDDLQTVMKVKQKLWYETGVMAIDRGGLKGC